MEVAVQVSLHFQGGKSVTRKSKLVEYLRRRSTNFHRVFTKNDRTVSGHRILVKNDLEM